ncbi:MAG: MFS transporter [Planctomycetota bacterium]
MYDLANQSFTLLIITLLFPLYFREVVVADPQRGDSLWSIAIATSQLLVVLSSPLLGAYADCRGCKKTALMLLGVVCAILTCALALLGQGDIALAFAVFVPANIVYQLGENFLASYLPHVSTPRTVGRISAIGWTSGYVGGLSLLILTIGGMFLLGWQDTAAWRPFFVLAGLWFAMGIIAPGIILREPPGRPLPPGQQSIASAAIARVGQTVRQASRYRELFRFLLAFFVYGLGVQVMVAFAAILASDFGINGTMLAVFVAQLTITAGLTAALTARFQDLLGARNTVILYLGIWTASALALAAITVFIPTDPPQWLFWLVGNGIGIGLGGIGTASRSVVARFSPKAQTAEFFGLWGFTYKLAAVVGVLSFGQVKAWTGGLLPFGNGNTPALLLLAGFFVTGLVLTLRVRESRGVRAAMRTDRAMNDGASGAD